jgi:uncharacterized protein
MAIGVTEPAVAAESPSYGSVAETGVEIKMDDGVVLIGDVMYPANPQTGEKVSADFPVILSQTPYGCDSSQTNSGFANASFFAENGYILASVCVRGSGRTGGEFTLFGEREQLDGVELVDWAAEELSGSNGSVGLLGGSYLGLNQFFSQGRTGPETPVKAMLPECAGGEFYRETYFSGGMPTQTANFPRNLGAIVGPRAGEFGLPLAEEIQDGGDAAYYRDFWKSRTPGNYAEAIADAGVPVLLWTSWDDIYTESAQSMYASLQNAYAGRPTYAPMEPGQPTTNRYQIIMSPGGHCAGVSPAVELEWMDTWLKEKKTRFSEAGATPMHLYQQGSGTWINTSNYPMVQNYTPYYLSADSKMSKSRPSRNEGSDELVYTQPAEPGGALTYTTEPLKHGATIAGPISATIHASSSSTNLNVIAHLESVAPDGTATRISSGSLVASLRQLDRERSWTDNSRTMVRPYGTFTNDDYLTPGKRYQLDVAMSPNLTQIPPGHSLRLVLNSQTALSVCAQGLGKDPCFPTDPQQSSLPGEYEIVHDAKNPSAINLPLLPYECFAPSGGSSQQPTILTGYISKGHHGNPCDYNLKP